ncbi:alkaline phosphatase [Pontiellaceae bacterium B12227]|nr:alkaline phosphatase [Pontiellaceae bacterium B12227]
MMLLKIIVQSCSLLLLLSANVIGGHPRNIILCIGDGMGPEQVKAARLYLGANLVFETFPYQSTITTHSANSSITDSAAASTAIATGKKVNNYVLSFDICGNGCAFETILEYYRSRGKSTGLISTAHITDATPAAFGAHEPSRFHYSDIASDYLHGSRPNVLFGGGGWGITNELFESSGYAIATDATGLFSFNSASNTHFAGFFGSRDMPYEYSGLGNFPHLHEMAAVALNLLNDDPDGFFLMVEGARIDDAGHNHLITNLVHEAIEFGNTVQTIVDWMGNRTDTLLVVTADHETGGLSATDNGAGIYPSATWTTRGHSDTPVPVYATGLNAALATNAQDNTHINGLLKSSAHVPENLISYTTQATNIQFVWTAYSNDVYHLQQISDLSSTNWENVHTATANCSRLSFNLPLNSSSNQVYYRLISD